MEQIPQAIGGEGKTIRGEKGIRRNRKREKGKYKNATRNTDTGKKPVPLIDWTLTETKFEVTETTNQVKIQESGKNLN